MNNPHMAPGAAGVNTHGRYANGAAHSANGSTANGHAGHLTPGDIGADFLRAFDPMGRHNVVHIDPRTRKTEGQTFAPGDWDGIRDHINRFAGKKNLYFSVNEPKENAPDRKLKKEHIAKVRAVCIDLDPNKKVLKEEKERGFERERERLAERMFELRENPRFPPTYTVDSGGGYQAFWRLSEAIPVGKDFAQAEAQGYGFVCHFGGDSVHTLDRIMRLPGTPNVLDSGKRALGRKPATARLVYDSGKTYRPEDLAAWISPVVPPENSTGDLPPVEIDMAAVRSAAEYDELPDALRSKFEAAKARGEQLARLWDDGDKSAIGGKDESPSGFSFALGLCLHQAGGFTATEFGQLVWVWDYSSDEEKIDKRYVARGWLNSLAGFKKRNPDVKDVFDPVDLGEAHAAEEEARAKAREEEARAKADDAEAPVDFRTRELAPPNLPRGVVPEIVERFAADQELGLGVERGAPAAALLTALGSLMTSHIVLRMQQLRTDWREPPITWVMTVAPPGSKKTAIFRAAVAPAKHIDAQRRREYDTAMIAHGLAHPPADKKKKKGGTAESLEGVTVETLFAPEPVLRRTIVNDATVERQVEILANNSHLLCANDEIASWIGGWDAYKSGKGVKDVSFYLSSYEGDSHSVERKTSGSAFAEKCAVSVIGGVQPAKAKTLFRGLTDNGLAQRIMPIYVKSLGDGQDVNPDPDIAATLERVAEKLASYEGRVHKFSPEAAAELKYVQEFAKREIESGRYSTAFVEWLNKTATIFGRLALISHYIESAYNSVAEPPELISPETARRARRYVCEFLFGHAEAFYAEVIGTTNADEHAEWIAGFILSRELRVIRERDIYRSYPALKGAKRDGIPDAMRTLELHDWVKPTKFNARGVPASWKVDERVHDGRFQEWADDERNRRDAAKAGIREDAEERRRAEEGAGR